ncbi:MAG: RNA polymerase subunit sigma-70 [Actinobacteria bacterium]|nr:MAG: RNA polymerase subunit sigma-70 [Actinomycetota bacterium]
MNERDVLTGEFERHRRHLQAVAYRMLGSVNEAEDAVQEAWLRLDRADTGAVANLGGWLTTVVARVCLDMLRAALLVVLDTLAPAERLAFVLHDMFAMPFEEIAPIVGRSPAATRQLASRARRRVQCAAPTPDPDLAEQRRVVDAFLTAARSGDFDALIEVLDPEVVFRIDTRARDREAVHGAEAVAAQILTRGRMFAPLGRPAIVNGSAGVIVMPSDRPIAVVGFTVSGGRIAEIDVIANPDKLRAVTVRT